jgi:nicotinamide mononucleotide transporter
MATTRTWMWSWYLWIAINCLQALYFGHFHLWGQFTLQFVLGAMSVSGLRKWRTVQRFNERAIT